MTFESEFYEQDMDVFKGTDVPVIVTITNATTSIATWTFAFTVRRRAGDSATPIFTKTTGFVINDTDKTVSFTIADELTNSVRIRQYYWDLKRTDTDNEKIVASGNFNLLGTAATPA